MTTPSEHGAARPAYAALAVVCVVWGTTYLAIRIALETVPMLLQTADGRGARVSEEVHEQRTGDIGEQCERQEPAHGRSF